MQKRTFELPGMGITVEAEHDANAPQPYKLTITQPVKFGVKGFRANMVLEMNSEDMDALYLAVKWLLYA